MQSPLFIFSLPRSGSTLLQRILMSHDDICSVAEPWILLPQIFSQKKNGTLSVYSSATCSKGINDFISNLPKKQHDYDESLKRFVLDLYQKQCVNNEIYFLDKTPRYYLIIDEIVELFPNAKFIFLFRNPMHAYASMISTWGNNRFNKFYGNYYDLTSGFCLISKGFVKHKDYSLAINYEELIQNPEETLLRLSNYLNIDLDLASLENFANQKPNGRLGDPTGVNTYNKISEEGLEKWKEIFNSFFRKRIVKRLINQFDVNMLEVQNYNKESILNEIKSLGNQKNHLFFRDVIDCCKSTLIRKFKLHLWLGKDFSWTKRKYLS